MWVHCQFRIGHWKSVCSFSLSVCSHPLLHSCMHSRDCVNSRTGFGGCAYSGVLQESHQLVLHFKICQHSQHNPAHVCCSKLFKRQRKIVSTPNITLSFSSVASYLKDRERAISTPSVTLSSLQSYLKHKEGSVSTPSITLSFLLSYLKHKDGSVSSPSITLWFSSVQHFQCNPVVLFCSALHFSSSFFFSVQHS